MYSRNMAGVPKLSFALDLIGVTNESLEAGS
jgi:hypothetical protein